MVYLLVNKLTNVRYTVDTPYSDIRGFKPYMNRAAASMRKLMLTNGFEFRCSSCGLEEWLGVTAPLQIDHIDGNRVNCLRSNLRFLCPNCHALTDTYAGRGNKLSPEIRFAEDKVVEAYNALVSDGVTPTLNAISVRMGMRIRDAFHKERIRKVCEDNGLNVHERPAPGSAKAPRTKITWPCPNDLIRLLESHPRTEVAKTLGVSDVAVKRHCERHGIQEPKSYRVSEAVKCKREAERKAKAKEDLESKRRKSKEPLVKLKLLHGTTAGYRLELRLGIPTCVRCRKANTEDSKKYKTK